MITASASDIQKNPRILTGSQETVILVDRRKKESLGFYVPKRRNKSIKNLAWKYKSIIPNHKKNLDLEEITKIAQKEYTNNLINKYKNL